MTFAVVIIFLGVWIGSHSGGVVTMLGSVIGVYGLPLVWMVIQKVRFAKAERLREELELKKRLAS